MPGAALRHGGMPFENAGYGTIGIVGIERVEVFEGPSAAIQGGGSLGGTINYVTKDVILLGSLSPDGRTLSRFGANVAFNDWQAGARLNLTGNLQIAGRPNLMVVGYDVSNITYYDTRYTSDTVRSIDIVNPDYSNPIISQTAAPDVRPHP